MDNYNDSIIDYVSEPEFKPLPNDEKCECGGQLYIAYAFGPGHLDDNPLTLIKCYDCGFYDTD